MGRQAHVFGVSIPDSIRYIIGSGPGWTGFIMLIAMIAIALTSHWRLRLENQRLFICVHFSNITLPVLWSGHGSFCMFTSDEDQDCQRPSMYSIICISGAVIFLLELIVRELRFGDTVNIIRVVQHRHNTMELRMRKGRLDPKPGQASIKMILAFVIFIDF